MATALEVCQSAYRQLNLDQVLVSFSTSQAFPYSVALDILQQTIRKLNRLNIHQHMVITQYVPASGRGVFSIYEFSPVLNPRSISKIRLEAPGTQHSELTLLPYEDFLALYSDHESKTGKPKAWTYFGANWATDVINDADYGLVVYYQQQLPVPMSEGEILAWPDADMDILIDGVVAHLSLKIQRDDGASLLGLWQQSVTKYFSNQYKNRGLPLQMPRRF
jgi:hypothetical protein